jgi:hypothetical protein
MNMVDVKRMASVTIVYEGIGYVKRGRTTYYTDPRTKPVNEGIVTVKPFAFNPDLYWIVCPHCQKIHEYPILRVRKKEMLVYGNCKGRVTKGLDQSPILIDESEVIEYLNEKYGG